MKSKTVEVPHLGGSVEVRPIPPKLQHAIHANAAKGGRLDSQELMVWKLVYGFKDPNFTEAEARKITQRFTLRVLQPIVDRIDQLSGTDEHLHGADRPHSMRKITEPAMMATTWLERFPRVVSSGARSRASHGPRPVHRRGSRRGERATSSSSDDPDPETPAARPCACGCGRPRQAGKVAPKSKQGRRKVPIPAVLRDRLVEYLMDGPDSGRIFVGARDGYERGREAAGRAGVEAPTLHECRHGYAALMLAAGVNVKALSTFMGHANIRITLDQYGHLLSGAEDEAAGLLDAFLARQLGGAGVEPTKARVAT
jgi:hypothetical protein